MSTLRREAINKIKQIMLDSYYSNNGEPLVQEQLDHAQAFCEKVVDTLLELRELSFLKKDELLENSDISWSMAADRPITQAHINKQQAVYEFEMMIDKQLARLPLNWTGFQDKDQDNFRNFLKKQRKDFGRELEKFVNWWMSNEWRVANPPWKLETIKTKWLSAFKEESKQVTEVKTDANDIPMSY